MASIFAVAIAAILQIILGISIFIEQNNDLCTTAPTLASWIFLIAFLDILLDICIYPVRYMHLPYICQVVAETLVTIFVGEFGSLVVWCTIEKICCKLCKSFLLLIGMTPRFYYAWEKYILGTATTFTSLSILLFVVQATDHVHILRKKSLRLYRNINSNLSEGWLKLRNLLLANKCASNNAILDNCAEVEYLDMDTEVLQPLRPNKNRRNRSRSRARRRK